MKKNIIILVVAIVSIMGFISTYNMSRRASYWMNRCYSAEEVIDRVEKDLPDYVLDVLSEGDEWNNWMEYYN